ncbi:MAG: hypothetical protein ACLGG0_14245 [Bacteriovoracia bacterium]
MESKQKPKLVPGGVQSETPVTDKIKATLEKKSDSVFQSTQEKKQESQVLTQREAVYIEVMRLVREEKIVVPNKQPVKPLLNETHIKKICAALVAGFQAKKITLKDTESNKKKMADAKAMELYCLGLLNNWLRRDKRINGVGIEK